MYANHQLPEMLARSPQHDFCDDNEPHAEQEYLLHPPFDFSIDNKRHDGGKGDHHGCQIHLPVFGGRETGIGKLAGQGDKGGHQ